MQVFVYLSCATSTRVLQESGFRASVETFFCKFEHSCFVLKVVLKIRSLAKPRDVSGNAKPKQGTMKPELKRIRKVEYDIDPNRYELRSGSETNAPLCPYGNIYKWVVFDLKANEYVRFAKSVFKLLINKNGK